MMFAQAFFTVFTVLEAENSHLITNPSRGLLSKSRSVMNKYRYFHDYSDENVHDLVLETAAQFGSLRVVSLLLSDTYVGGGK